MGKDVKKGASWLMVLVFAFCLLAFGGTAAAEDSEGQFTLTVEVEGQGFTLPIQGEHLSNIEMFADGQGVNFELPLVQHEEEILAPYRDLCEALGLDIEWLPETSEVAISNEDMILRYRSGEKTVYVNDEPVEWPVEPFVIQGSTIVPAWFLVNTFGYAERVEFELSKYEEGDEVELYAEPCEGWVFNKWVINGTEHTTSEVTVTMEKNMTATAFFKSETIDPPDEIFPPELDNMMIIGGIGVSIDLLFDNNELAREKINEALADPDVTFADVLINFTRADQFFWLLTREAPTADEVASIMDKITGYWNGDGEWVV